MKYSKTTLMELSSRYRAVLKKCFMLNAALLIGATIALPADAATVAKPSWGASAVWTGLQGQELVGVEQTQDITYAQNEDGSVTATIKNQESATFGAFSNYFGRDNRHDGDGDHVAVSGLTLKDSSFTSNKGVVGGAVSVWQDGLKAGTEVTDTLYPDSKVPTPASNSILNTTFDSNTADKGGALAYLAWNAFETTPDNTLKNVTFTGNAATGQSSTHNGGGAIYAESVNLVIDGKSEFKGNSSTTHGGAIYNKGSLTLVGAQFENNTATQYGGAIYNRATPGTETLIDTVTFIGNKAYAGGAIMNHDGTMNIVNSTFTGNQADFGGAYYSSTLDGAVNNIIDSVFENNTALGTGAVGLYSASTVLGSTFTGNKATDANDDGAGAVSLGSVAVVKIGTSESGKKTTFTANESAADGGAISMRVAENDNGSKNDNRGSLDISEATFTGNIAAKRGGAVYNTFHNDSADSGYVSVQKSVFEGNKADLGGAFYNDGTLDLSNKGGSVAFTDSGFTGNTAQTKGGAIYNDSTGVVVFKGTNVFSENKANGVLNDIHNDGVINVSGHLTLDGGVTGNGSLTFADGTALTSTLDVTKISNNVTFEGNNVINVLVNNTADVGEHDFITGAVVGVDHVTIGENALYNMTLTEKGAISVAVKSASELADEIPTASAQEADTIAAVVSTAGNGTQAGNAIANAISGAVQSGDTGSAIKAAKDLAPTTSSVVMGVAKDVNTVLSGVAAGRMASVGRSGGDTFTGGAMWVQGLYNYSEQDASSGNEGFDANTTGLSFGIDGKINDDLMVGIGYGYTYTDADSGDRSLDVDGHNFFLYSEYKQDNWFVNGMLIYGFSKYEEEKSPAGVALKAKYDVNTYGANVMAGYDLDNGITPEVGLRYLIADQKSYNDGAQRISSDKADVLTGVIGAKYTTDVKTESWTFKPNLRLAATYDMISDKSKANINVIGGGSYEITGERLERFGIEAGVGVETSYQDWDFSLNYSGGFRKDFQSHTGMLKAKYHF